jgi:5-formyltetrahydrofolate cyclo-ligase
VLKSNIRKKILKVRENNNKAKIYIKFSRIYNLLKKISNFKKKIIGGYYPVNSEIDDLEILKEFEKKKIRISLPMIKKNFKMDFIQCSLNKPFVINEYGIPEPCDGKIVYPDILLVPLVAFDRKLNRLGYGAGFYDRLIQSLKKRKNVITIGLAFDFQEVYLIPVSHYDQKLDFIVTNRKILK